MALVLSRTERTHPGYFWAGTLAVTAGVVLHLPMYIRSAGMNFSLAGMPVDNEMLVGMLLIVAGTALAYCGLLPRAVPAEASGAIMKYFAELSREPSAAARGRLNFAHWQLLAALTLGVVIDSMKPATLGFVIPGMAVEYGLPRQIVALFPFCALTGLTMGSYAWGVIADKVGRRAAILLAGILFVGTAICGSMPAFQWNLLMCFLMGVAAGGMIPITYALLVECIPTEQRGWAVVLVGTLGLIGGWFAASGGATLLEPYFGWRILWLLGAPTGLLLIVCSKFIPESPRYLLARGRIGEAHELVKRFAVDVDTSHWAGGARADMVDSARALIDPQFRTTTVTLNLTAGAWGLVNFGLLLWLPADLRARGYSVVGTNELLLYSSLLALPTTLLIAWFYSRWSTKWTLVALTVLTALALTSLSSLNSRIPLLAHNPFILISMLMVGVNGTIAVLLPYSAESYPVLVRGRATGLVAGTSKLGGLAVNALTAAALVPDLITAGLALAVPVALSACMIACYGQETRDHSLKSTA